MSVRRCLRENLSIGRGLAGMSVRRPLIDNLLLRRGLTDDLSVRSGLTENF